MSNLKKYNNKRNFNKTSEPVGKIKVKHQRKRFVVQHHLASHDHYDLRLELNGTLKSFAVPKGLSYKVGEKRLAVMVEDHPYSYRNFEGIIPKGEYGGGTVMIFDEGYWECYDNPNTSFKKGIVKFKLDGQRLKGSWSLIHLKENNWLLIKEKDQYANYTDISKYKTSVKTGRTMKEILKNKTFVKDNDKTYIETIEITNPNKVIYNKPKITKLDIVKYYQKVAKRMLPYLDKRLISTIRCPNGMNGDKFFKKHLEKKRDGIKKVIIPSLNHKEDYYYIETISGLISEVGMNSYEFHIWGGHLPSNKPDMMVFDLDPDENVSLKKLREGVKDLKSILDSLSLKSFLKTSGGKGYHVVVPIHSIKNWDDFRLTAKNIAKLMEMKWPDKYVSNMSKKKRKNKIYIDWVRNNYGSTSVCPYSIRLRDNAPVSMPIKWNELDKIKPNEITMKEALKRINKKDPWEGFWEVKQ